MYSGAGSLRCLGGAGGGARGGCVVGLSRRCHAERSWLHSCAQALPPTPMRVCMLARAVGEGAAVCAARARQCWRFYGPPAARGRARRKCWIIKLSARVRAGA